MASESDHDPNGEESNSDSGARSSVTSTTQSDQRGNTPENESSPSESLPEPSPSTDGNSASSPFPTPIPSPVEDSPSEDPIVDVPLPVPVDDGATDDPILNIPLPVPVEDSPSEDPIVNVPLPVPVEDSSSEPSLADTPIPAPVEEDPGELFADIPLPTPVSTEELPPEEISEAPKKPPKPDVAPSWLPDLYSAADAADTTHAVWEVLKTLQYYPDEDILDVGEQFLESSNRHKQVLSISFLGDLTPGSTEAGVAIPLLIKSMFLTDPQVVSAAVLSLAELSPEKLMERASSLLKHTSVDIRKAFASAARKIKTASSIDCLLALSRDDEISVRRWSILECYRVGPLKDGEIQSMMAQRLFEDDARNLSELIDVLARNREPFLVEYLAEALSLSAVPPHIIEAAGTLGDTRLYTPLWDLAWTWTGSPNIIDTAVRSCRWDDPRPLFELVEAAMDEEQFEKSEAAIAALQRRGGREVFDAAEALCNNRGTQARLVAARVLGQIGGPRSKLRLKAVEPLSKMLEDRDDDVIATAIEGIGAVQESEIAKAVASLQTHDNPEVRNAVSVILYGIDDPASTKSMIALSTAREGMVRFAASQALDGIMNPQGPEEGEATVKIGSSSGGTGGGEDSGPIARSIRFGVDKEYEGIGYLEYPKRKWENIIKAVVGTLLVLTIAIAVYTLKFYEGAVAPKTDNPELVEALAKREFSSLRRPSPNDLVKERKEGEKGMFETSRLLKLASMLRLPIQNILKNKKECWYLYNRMDPQDAAWILSRAPTPTSPNTPEGQNLRLILSILTNEASSDNHRRVANFLRHLAPQSPELASYMIEEILAEIPNWQQDDLVMDFAEVGTELQAMLASAGYRVKFHPALLNLVPRVRQLMETKLRTGWPAKRELELANHLKLLNRGIRIRKKR